MADDVFEKLATHLGALGMGYPPASALIEILTEVLSPEEARLCLSIPTRTIPFEPVSAAAVAVAAGIPAQDARECLEGLAARGLLFSRKIGDGEMGYALQQFGFGFPQTFFWAGADTPLSRKLAGLIVRYSRREQLREAYGKAATKPLRFVPASSALRPEEHAVFPYHLMEHLLSKVSLIALAHCPCRMTAQLLGKRRCDHPLEVCMKYDDLARYLIDRKMGRRISADEALNVIKSSEARGLVHLVDNAGEDIRHTCNCCGCCCWSVGSIRRRSIPRDVIMATYFLRETDMERCTGCGACVDACPVAAIRMEDGSPVVDLDWCLGCGVCLNPCPSEAVFLVKRPDASLPRTFKDLHSRILREKGLG